MNDDVRIWEIDDSSKAATPVESTNRMETEQLLEVLLVRNPDMLMPGLTLVGRQMPTDGGVLDLLGVDRDGRLVVFELKKEMLTRDAVAQIIDYCSWLESLTGVELAKHIVEHSGGDGIDKIDDLESWCGVRQGKQLIDLRPTRMVLVGLGADARARRMVEFLIERGVDISLLTFHGYRQGARTLLARQAERAVEAPDDDSQRTPSAVEARNALAGRAREWDMSDLWQDAVKALSIASRGDSPTKNGITFLQPKITLPGESRDVNVLSSHSVTIESRGKIRVTFYPGAVHVCLDKFQDKRRQETIQFYTEAPPHAWATDQVPEQWYCLLDKSTWEQYKPALTALAQDVHNAWLEFWQSGTEA